MVHGGFLLFGLDLGLEGFVEFGEVIFLKGGEILVEMVVFHGTFFKD